MACALICGSMLAALTGCGSGAPSRTTSPTVTRPASPTVARPVALTVPRALTVTVHSSGPGTRLPAGFVGLGLEANTLARDEFPATNLGDFMARLDPHGLLRIGGNSVESFWTSTDEPAPRWSHGRITPADLRGLATMLAHTGWQVILGVAFKHDQPARAADEARYARRILGARLRAVEIGNEPNLYGISRAAFFARFQRFAAAIHAAVPGVPLAGPATGRTASSWLTSFVHAEASHPDVALLTAHEYPLTRCNGQHPTIAQLLSRASVENETRVAEATVSGARRLGVPAVIDETNSVICWGEPGVSDTYASALWILDYGLLLAQHGVSAANFQTRISGCKPYLPVCTRAHSTQLYARPEFYGLLALGQVTPGHFLDVENPAPTGVRAFAVSAGPGRLSVVLDDLATATTVHVRLPGSGLHEASQTVLVTRSARGLRATGGISLGGARVSADARMPAPRYRPLAVRGNRVTVHLPAHSAVILRVS